jgi:hypothetical protein
MTSLDAVEERLGCAGQCPDHELSERASGVGSSLPSHAIFQHSKLENLTCLLINPKFNTVDPMTIRNIFITITSIHLNDLIPSSIFIGAIERELSRLPHNFCLRIFRRSARSLAKVSSRRSKAGVSSARR